MRIIMPFAALLLTILGFAPSVVTGQDAETIKLLTSVRSPIFERLTSELFERIGVKYELVKVPWHEALQKLKNGDADGVPFMFFTKDRAEFVEYSEPVFDTGLGFYALADSHIQTQLTSFDELRPYSIGLVKDYAYCKEFKEAIAQLPLDVHYEASIDHNYQKLNDAKVDCIAIQDFFTDSASTTGELTKTNFRKISNDLCSQMLYIAFSKKSPATALIPDLNRAIQGIKTDGTLDRLLSR